uniref:Slc39a-5 n=1 Tax=Schmidtea mediterranea TaxID=79327 RepID=A0A0H3YFB6_SCHMD|nr:slc39a-5 [Schmidtea mediterranea]
MIIKFCLQLLFFLLSVTLISSHQFKAKSYKPSEQDILISDFFHHHFDISIRVKLLWQIIYSVIGSILVGLSGILPLLFISSETGVYLRSKSGMISLNRWLGFAFGSIIGDVFLHLLPEAWESIHQHEGGNSHMIMGLSVIVGFLLFFVIEKIFIANSYEPENCQQKEKKLPNGKSSNTNGIVAHDPIIESGIKAEGYLNLLANFTDNFTHGLAIGGSFLISFKIGVLTTTCILIHEIPHEVSDFVILLRAGFDRWKAAKLQLLTACGSCLGAVFALTADSTTTGLSKTFILPFTSGAFIYIAMVSLLPSILAESSFRESIIQLVFLASGFLIMVTMSQYCS